MDEWGIWIQKQHIDFDGTDARVMLPVNLVQPVTCLVLIAPPGVELCDLEGTAVRALCDQFV